MKDFSFYAPTQVVFGAQSEEKIPQLIKRFGGFKQLTYEDVLNIYTAANE